ncbi:MAG: hypothetical protein R6X02_24630 [Enhygromyxa sp.]
MTIPQEFSKLADLIADTATVAYRKARQDLIDSKIDADAYNRATRQFNDAIEMSTRIAAIGLHNAASDLELLTEAVENARDQVREAIEKIEHASDVLTILGQTLAFAASIVAAAAAPALIPGAIGAGISLANTINQVAAGS